MTPPRSRVLVAMRVRASPERAFSAFTEEIAQWWKPNGLFQFTENRNGTLAFEPGP
ncbi:MAG: Activator of Hsp90 ATPase 1 family protein, partial [Acidimicrobiia bacterium]|nr:Activator of Hsp90 ATPase 1 family protein [Acidimicrobiia bacterium]